MSSFLQGEWLASPVSEKIKEWCLALSPGAELRVIFGGHWSDNPGWLILDQVDQDIARPLVFPDNSVDVIFTEHVVEHVDFAVATGFSKEALRILKPGGIFRVVCPMLDSILQADFSGPQCKEYVTNSLIPCFPREHTLLLDILGKEGILGAPFEFFLNSMFRKHGHRFLWSSDLFTRVLYAIGYEHACRYEIGEGANLEYCIERRRRGVYLGNDWREEVGRKDVFDLESTVVEARKARVFR